MTYLISVFSVYTKLETVSLLDDEEIHKLSQDEDMGYFNMCKSLYVTPDFMSFKLFSLIRRGHAYNLPQGIDSRFLAK